MRERDTMSVVYSQPVAGAGPDIAICVGDTITLFGTGTGIVYNWSGGVTDGIPFIPLASTTLIMTAIDTLGCTNTDNMNITVQALPVIGLQSPFDTACVYHNGFTLSTTPNYTMGLLTGPGVVNDTFDPAAAGVGNHTITFVYTDGFGCTSDSSIVVIVDNCIGMDDLYKWIELEIYPNPTTDFLTIEGDFKDFPDAVLQLSAYDGRVVLSQACNKKMLDVSQLATGVYLLEIKLNRESDKKYLKKIGKL
ncbi:MAG: T9SS type A sorting domain-containing protein [Flavobacteriales bacterium]